MKHSTTVGEKIAFLRDECTKFLKALEHFSYLFHDVSGISISGLNTPEELIRIEALTARFERVVDLFLGKVIRMIVLCETGLDEGTVRDNLLFVQKLGLITDVEARIDMRSLRNMIVHDYLYQEHQEFFDYIEKLWEQEISSLGTRMQEYMKKWK